MIIGKKKEQVTTQTYRSIEVDSYSTLKLFVESPLQYMKEQILGERRKEKKSSAIILGDLVDCLMYCPEEYNLKFEEATCGEIDKNKTTQIGLFTLELFNITENSVNEDGECTRDFLDMAEEAFNKVKFNYNGEEVAFKKKELEYAIDQFSGSKFEEWYNMQRRGFSKTIIDMQTKTNADKIVEELKTNSRINWIFEQEDDVDVLYQQQIEFDLFGILPFKSMFDIMRINLKNETIQPIDGKTSWEILNFEYNFFKMKYWIQAGCYNEAAQIWRDKYYPEFTVLPISYLVADSTNQYEPLLYELDNDNLSQFIEGFEMNGRPIEGIRKIVDNLIWAKEENNFRLKRNDYLNNNTRKLQLFK